MIDVTPSGLLLVESVEGVPFAELQAKTGAPLGRASRSRSMNVIEAFICDAVRTPIGRYGGALVVGPRRRPRRDPDQGADGAESQGRLGRRRRRDLRLRQPGRRGQPQRRPHVGAARRPAGRRSGRDDQPPVRLGHGRGRHRGARDQVGRGRADDRRRRREHEPRAVRHAQGRERVLAHATRSTTRPSAGASSTR